MKYVIGCDIGTQSLKLVMISEKGQIFGDSSISYPIIYSRNAWAEQSPGSWMDALTQAMRTLLVKTGISPRDIIAIGLDAQVDGVVAVDKQGKPLYPAIIWIDHRAVSQCEAAGRKVSQEDIRIITGLNLDPSHVAPKIKWLADNQPHIFNKTAHFLLPGSYVAFELTGELGVDYSNASSTLLMDVRNRTWSHKMCDIFEIPMESLPPIYPATHVIGQLKPDIAEKLGLLAKTKVILGSGDEHAACLGAGVIRPGLVCDIAGTGEAVCISSKEVLFDDDGLVETHCHADPELWLLENPGFSSGANYRWFCDQFAHPEIKQAAKEGVDVYTLLNSAAETIPPGCDGLIMLPCLMGALTPTWNSLARGAFTGFTLSHRREHFCRAILESSAYALRDITDQMVKLGLPLEEIRVVGGGSRSPLWRQIKADVTGIPVSITNTSETTVLGAGILALTGSGLIDTLGEAVNLTTYIVETSQPNKKIQSIYEEFYQLYRLTYFSLLPVFEQGSKIKL